MGEAKDGWLSYHRGTLWARTMEFQCLRIVLATVILCSCNTTGLVRVDGHGCTNLVPAAVIKEKGVNLELANLAIGGTAIGQFRLTYEETMRTLLTDEVLGEWVRLELVCQASKSFRSPEHRLWYLALKEVSRKASAEELIGWLKDNPVESFRAELAEKPYQIDSIVGSVRLPPDLVSVRVRSIKQWGSLYVPGPTQVVVAYCNGTIYQSAEARVIVEKAGKWCRTPRPGSRGWIADVAIGLLYLPFAIIKGLWQRIID